MPEPNDIQTIQTEGDARIDAGPGDGGAQTKCREFERSLNTSQNDDDCIIVESNFVERSNTKTESSTRLKRKMLKNDSIPIEEVDSSSLNNRLEYLEYLNDHPHDVETWVAFSTWNMAKENRHAYSSIRILARGLEQNPASFKLWKEYINLFFPIANDAGKREIMGKASAMLPDIDWNAVMGVKAPSPKVSRV